MPNDPVESLLKKIDAYDGSEEHFAALVAEALGLASSHPTFAEIQKELAIRSGPVAVSTVGYWARDAMTPGPNVREFVLQELADILVESRSP